MASVFKKRGRFYVCFKDVSGEWKRRATTFTKTKDALALAHELER